MKELISEMRKLRGLVRHIKRKVPKADSTLLDVAVNGYLFDIELKYGSKLNEVRNKLELENEKKLEC